MYLRILCVYRPYSRGFRRQRKRCRGHTLDVKNPLWRPSVAASRGPARRGLALAVYVGGERQGVGILQRRRDRPRGAAVGGVDHGEVPRGIDRAVLGRRFDDHDLHGSTASRARQRDRRRGLGRRSHGKREARPLPQGGGFHARCVRRSMPRPAAAGTALVRTGPSRLAPRRRYLECRLKQNEYAPGIVTGWPPSPAGHGHGFRRFLKCAGAGSGP